MKTEKITLPVRVQAKGLDDVLQAAREATSAAEELVTRMEGLKAKLELGFEIEVDVGTGKEG